MIAHITFDSVKFICKILARSLMRDIGIQSTKYSNRDA